MQVTQLGKWFLLPTTDGIIRFPFMQELVTYLPSIFSRLLAIAEETLTEFLSKATGTAVDWVPMPGMKVSCQFWRFFVPTLILTLSGSMHAHLFLLPVISLVRIRLVLLPFHMVAEVSLPVPVVW